MAADDARLEFNRDVRPILAEFCFSCHGPDSASRQAELRLDQREAAVASGAIDLGQPESSELIARIGSTDPDSVMPPPETKKRLSVEQQHVLRRWIAAGAEYQPHWSLIPPVKRVPPPSDGTTVQNPIDQFVIAGLRAAGLEPASEADRSTLVRRVSLDLTGLPPPPELVHSFVHDESPDAYERLVDSLLASPAWGEHRARYWLDYARYADTHGLHLDTYREMWTYRDWVISAFNRNQPFDEFSVETLAGDLLPEPSLEQLIASGFNRCHMTTNEGGIIPEEYLVLYTRDRVETTAQVWLGLTAGCAVCHSHKFDPLSQREFYELAAFFNHTTQEAKDGEVKDSPPVVIVPIVEDRPRWAQLTEAALSLNSRIVERSKVVTSEGDAELGALKAELAAISSEQDEIKSRGSVAYVMQEKPGAAVSEVLRRGEYDQPLETVTPATPAALPPFPPDFPRNRLGFARWLFLPQHPLTARVTVNRYWHEVFGVGLVRTTGDFGVMGELPTHPELLDWLAVEFEQSGWDVKHLLRLIVTSATYRQAAVVTPEKRERDPDNRLLSRGPRFRMDAEMVRDCALAASGTLAEAIGGPSVKPYQPAGVWEQVGIKGSNTRDYQQGAGADLYRRSVYTFVKRMAPPPVMEVFNAPNREYCVVCRERTNTPLQALASLNDEQLVEAARVLAADAIRSSETDEERLAFISERILSREFAVRELAAVRVTLTNLRAHFTTTPDESRRLIEVGESEPDASVPPAELAAWTMLVNEFFNLDEALNK
jgi:hypothetical protein